MSNWKLFELTFDGLNESDEGVDSGSGWNTSMNWDVPHDMYLEADLRYARCAGWVIKLDVLKP